MQQGAERVTDFLTGLGHPRDAATAMAANLLGETVADRRTARRYGSLTMTPDERERFAGALQARRVLIEGTLLSLGGRDVREGAVLAAHALCEARQTRRALSLRIGGARAEAEHVEAARQRLAGELDAIDSLVEAAVEGNGEKDVLSQGVGGGKPHPRVVHLQNRLNMLGHRVAADGRFGPVTAEAVKDFQAKAGLEPSGEVDERTRNALRHGRQVVLEAPPAIIPQQAEPQLADIGDGDPNGEKAEPSAPALKVVPRPLRLGTGVGEDAHPDVQAMQRGLSAAGHPLAQDGQFGPETAAALKKFQRAHGLPVTGAADDRTMRALKAKSGTTKAEEAAVEEAVKSCPECGAPMREGGKVCQRGHRLPKAMQEAWSPEARAAALAAREHHGSGWDGNWDKAPGGKRYEMSHGGHSGKIVKQNTAAGGPRWKAYHTGPDNVTRIVGKGDSFAEVKQGATDHIHQAVAGSSVAARMHAANSGGKLSAEAKRERDLDDLSESAQTAALSVTHAPIGKGGTNWVTKSKPGNTGQLPAYIQNVRNAIMRSGHDESSATAIAVGRIRDWAEGKGGVGPEVKAAAAKAIAEWEAMRGASHAKSATKDAGRAVQEAKNDPDDDGDIDAPGVPDIDPDELEKRLGDLKAQGDDADGVEVARANQQAARLIAAGKVKAGRFSKIREADSRADFPAAMACPTCGARTKAGAKTCPRGHSMTGAHALRESLIDSVIFRADVELLLRECPELRETWEDFDAQRHKASWAKHVKTGPMPGSPWKDSPGRGPTGKLRNFNSMSSEKLGHTLEALMVHGEDHEAHEAAMLSAGSKLGLKIRQPAAPKPATHTLLDEEVAVCECGAPSRNGVVCQRGHRLEEAIGSIDKGAFHRWLGKGEDEPITDADIARGLAAGGHPAKMAQFAKSARSWGK